VNEGFHVSATHFEITSNGKIAAVASALISPSLLHQNNEIEGYENNILSS
jgi:hypothetical protein